jgi:phosphoglucomutase
LCTNSTGSNHIREKDGIWAVLAWLSIMEFTRKSIEDILVEHWKKYGRNYFTRYDYEGCDAGKCNSMMEALEQKMTEPKFLGQEFSHGVKTYKVRLADNFSYNDPIDKSISTKQVIVNSEFKLNIRLTNVFLN